MILVFLCLSAFLKPHELWLFNIPGREVPLVISQDSVMGPLPGHWWFEQVSQKGNFWSKVVDLQMLSWSFNTFSFWDKQQIWSVTCPPGMDPLPPQRVSSTSSMGYSVSTLEVSPTPQALANPTSFLPMGRLRPREESRVKERYHHWSDNDGMKRVSEFMKTNHSTELNQAYSSTEKVVKEVGDVIWKCIVQDLFLWEKARQLPVQMKIHPQEGFQLHHSQGPIPASRSMEIPGPSSLIPSWSPGSAQCLLVNTSVSLLSSQAHAFIFGKTLHRLRGEVPVSAFTDHTQRTWRGEPSLRRSAALSGRGQRGSPRRTQAPRQLLHVASLFSGFPWPVTWTSQLLPLASLWSVGLSVKWKWGTEKGLLEALNYNTAPPVWYPYQPVMVSYFLVF